MDSKRPVTTLFMLISVDGKISTGDTDDLDFDKDLSNLEGTKQGLKQYYELEQQTDLHSFNSGRVFEKMGVNKGEMFKDDVPVTFVLVDNTHLQERGIKHLLEKTAGLVLATSNKEHPALGVTSKKLKVIQYEENIDFSDLFKKLKQGGIESLTIQSGGTINSILVREKLIDKLSIVVAPLLVGGEDTASLIDGNSLSSKSELDGLAPLRLTDVTKLKDSYTHLQYEVI